MAQWERIHLPVQEIQVQSLGQEDPLEKKKHPEIKKKKLVLKYTNHHLTKQGCQNPSIC